MDDLNRALADILAAGPGRFVLSAPRGKGQAARRATVTKFPEGWQVERFTETQAFHQNITEGELPGTLAALLQTEFTQLTALAEGGQHQLRLTKKGKVLTTKGAATGAAAARPGHDRPKSRILPEGTVVPPLVDIGVMGSNGNIIAAKRDKYRQINRFLEIVADTLPQEAPGSLRVVDFGCGKSSLTFLLYYYLREIRGINAHITGLDLKEGVVAHCNAAAEKYGYDGLRFLVGDIGAYTAEHNAVDMVVTLHACDTATDHALAKAVGWGAKTILSVPCCQHEANAQMQSDELALLCRYGIVKERTAALMTDAIRANLLAACGYKAQLLEFVGFEHTPKNIMIRATMAGMGTARATRQNALDEVTRLAAAFSLEPCLLRLLQQANALSL